MPETNILVVGIDPSAKKIAIVAACPLLLVSHVEAFVLYKGTAKQTPESLGRALDAMAQFLVWADQAAPHGERYAWVEDPLVGRGGVITTMKQAFVGGIIRATLVNAGFKVYGVNVSTWKKDVCGTGLAKKPDVLRCVKTQWPKVEPLIGTDGDLADAAAICLYGQSVLAKSATQNSLRTPQDVGDAKPPRRSVRRPRPRTMVRTSHVRA